MGEARNRGTYEERRAEAIKRGGPLPIVNNINPPPWMTWRERVALWELHSDPRARTLAARFR